jgi:addiction module RelB/DinJ family antitoxin
MPTSVINIKTDAMLKKEAQEVARDMGLPLGTIINSYLRELVRERRVISSAPLAVNKKTAKLLKEIDSDIKAGKNADGPFTYDEAIEYLNKL